MSQGVPGIPPPEAVQSALGAAASSPVSFGYCRWDGEPTLRNALVGEMKRVYGEDSDLHVDDVALTSGCNLAFVAAAMSVADPGDEVILPVPWCVSFRTLLCSSLIKSSYRYFNHQSVYHLTVATTTLSHLDHPGCH